MLYRKFPKSTGGGGIYLSCLLQNEIIRLVVLRNDLVAERVGCLCQAIETVVDKLGDPLIVVLDLNRASGGVVLVGGQNIADLCKAVVNQGFFLLQDLVQLIGNELPLRKQEGQKLNTGRGATSLNVGKIACRVIDPIRRITGCILHLDQPVKTVVRIMGNQTPTVR